MGSWHGMAKTIASSATGARFSTCKRWRYLLWRRWDEVKPVANFLMLNPSTADEGSLDPTCARARDFAERWGYGGLIVTNVFAWRATDPRILREVSDPVGRANDGAIMRAAREAALVVAAWGNHGTYLRRSERVLGLLRGSGVALHALRTNGGGEPAHPLYLSGRLMPVPFSARENT